MYIKKICISALSDVLLAIFFPSDVTYRNVYIKKKKIEKIFERWQAK